MKKQKNRINSEKYIDVCKNHIFAQKRTNKYMGHGYATQNAITLIALIITIIILLILAGVTITVIFGDNGLIEITKYSKEESNKAQAKEELELKLADIILEKRRNNIE